MLTRVKLDKEKFLEILEVIQTSILVLIRDEGKIPVQVIEPMNEQWADVINRHYPEIYTQTHEKINKYLNFYNVYPESQNCDEFKYIYFIGLTVANKLKEEGMIDHTKYHLRAILRLLDYRLLSPYNAYRPQLSERIQKAIENHKVYEHYGEFGWYLLYKCLYNAAAEAHKKAP